MNKIESIARELLNKRCALSWAEFKSLYPVLYEFMQDEDPEACAGGVAEDNDRAVNQTRGIGYVQERAEKDRAEFNANAVIQQLMGQELVPEQYGGSTAMFETSGMTGGAFMPS